SSSTSMSSPRSPRRSATFTAVGCTRLSYSPAVALLEVDSVTKRFGGIVALDGVSFEVGAGEIVGLIGPNGAGKTTAFNVITRLYTPDSGDVRLDGASLLPTRPPAAAASARPRDARCRPHVPDRRALPRAHGVRERADRRAREAGRAHGGRRDLLPRARLDAESAGRRSVVRDAEARRARARTCVLTARAAPRRARGRAQPRGGAGSREAPAPAA